LEVAQADLGVFIDRLWLLLRLVASGCTGEIGAGGRRGGRRRPPCRSGHVRDGRPDADAARGLARPLIASAVSS